VPFLAAALWSISASFGLQLLAVVIISVRGADHLDVVSGVLCEAAAFTATLFLVVRVHDRERPLSQALALRPTRFSLCALAAAIGIGSQAPFNLIGELIEKRFPPSAEDLASQAEVFAAPTPLRKFALVLAVGIVGPIVEELFFRGGLYRGIRRAHGSAISVLGVALLFAAVHIGSFAVPLFLFPVFLVGLMLGHVRAVSGSLWPSFILHAAFNTTSAVASLLPGPLGEKGVSFSIPVSLGCLGGAAALLGLYHLIASRSAACREARELDLA
jgi:uncharacterized protein